MKKEKNESYVVLFFLLFFSLLKPYRIPITQIGNRSQNGVHIDSVTITDSEYCKCIITPHFNGNTSDRAMAESKISFGS